MKLYNTLSAEERAQLIDEAGKDRLTISFYQYHNIEDPQAFRDELYLAWDKQEVLGRIYVAQEGINAQLSVPAENFHKFKDFLDSYSFLKDIRLNVAIEQDNKSFLKLKVKVRSKIVADGLDDSTFDPSDCGVHLKAQDFNNIIAEQDTVLVDMRNHFESEIGHFEGAITPDVDTFRASLDIIEDDLKDHKEDKNLVMYCTGGIRCEKASAYFKHKGFKNVYQLEGGIIEYVRQIKDENLENKFHGKNFVFDNRMAEKVSDEVISNCHQCGEPSDTHNNCRNKGCNLLFLQCESCATKMSHCCSDQCQEIAALPLEEQKEIRKGQGTPKKYFKKGRAEHLG